MFVEKIPVLGIDYDEIPELPFECYIPVLVEKDFGDTAGINTDIHYHIEADNGETHLK